MLAGDDVALTSSSAGVCTLESERYPIRLNGHNINVHDTAGLCAPRGANFEAIAKLFKLIHFLAKGDGIDFLVMVVQKDMLSKETVAENYKLFRDIFCRACVPVVIAATGFEFGPEDHWRENIRAFNGLTRDDYIGVTAIKGKDLVHQQQYDLSCNKLRNMIASRCNNTVPWMEDLAASFTPQGKSTVQKIQNFLSWKMKKKRRELITALMKFAELQKGMAEVIADCVESCLSIDSE
jgi:hypothetical protein